MTICVLKQWGADQRECMWGQVLWIIQNTVLSCLRNNRDVLCLINNVVYIWRKILLLYRYFVPLLSLKFYVDFIVLTISLVCLSLSGTYLGFKTYIKMITTARLIHCQFPSFQKSFGWSLCSVLCYFELYLTFCQRSIKLVHFLFFRFMW
jgi:hypothetical protein